MNRLPSTSPYSAAMDSRRLSSTASGRTSVGTSSSRSSPVAAKPAHLRGGNRSGPSSDDQRERCQFASGRNPAPATNPLIHEPASEWGRLLGGGKDGGLSPTPQNYALTLARLTSTKRYAEALEVWRQVERGALAGWPHPNVAAYSDALTASIQLGGLDAAAGIWTRLMHDGAAHGVEPSRALCLQMLSVAKKSSAATPAAAQIADEVHAVMRSADSSSGLRPDCSTYCDLFKIHYKTADTGRLETLLQQALDDGVFRLTANISDNGRKLEFDVEAPVGTPAPRALLYPIALAVAGRMVARKQITESDVDRLRVDSKQMQAALTFWYGQAGWQRTSTRQPEPEKTPAEASSAAAERSDVQTVPVPSGASGLPASSPAAAARFGPAFAPVDAVQVGVGLSRNIDTTPLPAIYRWSLDNLLTHRGDPGRLKFSFDMHCNCALDSRFHEHYMSISDEHGSIGEVERAWQHLTWMREHRPGAFPDGRAYQSYLLAQIHQVDRQSPADAAPIAAACERAWSAWKDLTENGAAHGVWPNTAIYKRMLELAARTHRPDTALGIWSHMTENTQNHDALEDVGIYKSLTPIIARHRLGTTALQVSESLRLRIPRIASRLVSSCNALLRTFAACTPWSRAHWDEARMLHDYVGPMSDKTTRANWLAVLESATRHSATASDSGIDRAVPMKVLSVATAEAVRSILSNGFENGPVNAKSYATALKLCRATDQMHLFAEVFDRWFDKFDRPGPLDRTKCQGILGVLAFDFSGGQSKAAAILALTIYRSFAARGEYPDVGLCNQVLKVMANAGLVHEAMVEFGDFLDGTSAFHARPDNLSYVELLRACPDDASGIAAIEKLLTMGAGPAARIFDPRFGFDAVQCRLDLHRRAIMAATVPASQRLDDGIAAPLARAIFLALVDRGAINDDNIGHMQIVTGVGRGVLSGLVKQLARDRNWQLAALIGRDGLPNHGCLVQVGGKWPSAAPDPIPANVVAPPASLSPSEAKQLSDEARVLADPTSRQLVGNAGCGRWLADITDRMAEHALESVSLVLVDGSLSGHATLTSSGEGVSRTFQVVEHYVESGYGSEGDTEIDIGKRNAVRTRTLADCFPGFAAMQRASRVAERNTFAVGMSPLVDLPAAGSLRYLDRNLGTSNRTHPDAYRDALGTCLQNNMPAAFRALCRQLRADMHSPADRLSFMHLRDDDGRPLLPLLLRDPLVDPAVFSAYGEELADMAAFSSTIAQTVVVHSTPSPAHRARAAEVLEGLDLASQHLERLESEVLRESDRRHFLDTLDAIATMYLETGASTGLRRSEVLASIDPGNRSFATAAVNQFFSRRAPRRVDAAAQYPTAEPLRRLSAAPWNTGSPKAS